MISCVRGLVLAWIAAGVLLLLYVLQRRQVALVCRGRSTDSIRRPRSAALSSRLPITSSSTRRRKHLGTVNVTPMSAHPQPYWR
jgi:hypothetical protein